jgi:hypothetical protein
VAQLDPWNLLHLARVLKDAGGIPAPGNQRSEWDVGCRFDYPKPRAPLRRGPGRAGSPRRLARLKCPLKAAGR